MSGRESVVCGVRRSPAKYWPHGRPVGRVGATRRQAGLRVAIELTGIDVQVARCIRTDVGISLGRCEREGRPGDEEGRKGRHEACLSNSTKNSKWPLKKGRRSNNNMYRSAVTLLLLCGPAGTTAVDNGIGLTPPMGWR